MNVVRAPFVENGYYCLAVSELFDARDPARGTREHIARLPCTVVDALPDDDTRLAALVAAAADALAGRPAAAAAPRFGASLKAGAPLDVARARDILAAKSTATVGLSGSPPTP